MPRDAEKLWEAAAPLASISKLKAHDIGSFLALDIPPREMLVDPILPSQGLAMMYSKRGVGKTHIALGIAYAVAAGATFLRWTVSDPRPVLYLDGEMPARTMQERLASIVASNDKEPPSADFLKIITPDLQDEGFPDLASAEGQQAVEPHLKDVALVVVDNLSTLCRFGRENEAESWGPVQEWILGLRKRGLSVLLVHHANKTGSQRGTSRREDVLDTVINLRHPDDYQPEEGARFEVHIEKGRHIVGADAKAFEAKLRIENDVAIWTTRDLEDVTLQRVVDLTGEGLTVREIADETGLSKSRVNRLQAKGRMEGLIDE